MKISYLLVTKNNSKTLEKTLKSLPGKILAIDLNSNDNTLDILKKYNVEYLTKNYHFQPALGRIYCTKHSKNIPKIS